jgi:multidrug resistance efflux pump
LTDQPWSIIELTAHEGEFVPKEAILLRLDDRPVRFLLEQAKVAWKLAKSKLDRAHFASDSV